MQTSYPPPAKNIVWNPVSPNIDMPLWAYFLAAGFDTWSIHFTDLIMPELLFDVDDHGIVFKCLSQATTVLIFSIPIVRWTKLRRQCYNYRRQTLTTFIDREILTIYGEHTYMQDYIHTWIAKDRLSGCPTMAIQRRQDTDMCSAR